MDNVFFAYIQRLEIMAFFSGFPLIYAVIAVMAGSRQAKNSFRTRMVSLLPYSYALVGTLYLGLQLRNLYPDYSFENIKNSLQQPWLTAWGLLSILFWIPVFSKKPVFCLLHSFVFFFFLIRDLVSPFITKSPDKNILKNDMKIYTDSLLLNLGAFALIVVFSFFYSRHKKS